MKKGLGLLFFIIFCAPMIHAESIEYHPVTELADIATAFAKSAAVIDVGDTVKFSVPIKEVPNKLARCHEQIEPSLPPGATSASIHAILLSCHQTIKPWETIIPIKMSVMTQVMVASKNIPSGRVISADDLTFSWFNKDQLYNGYYHDKESTIGLVAEKLIMAGIPINGNNTRFPILVHKNEEVTLYITQGAVRVSMKGISKSDGRLNQMVQVMNPQSKKIVDAVVIGERSLKL